MTRTSMTWGIVVAAAGMSAGCKETVDSANVRTGGVAALIDVTALSEDASRVYAELRVGGDESNTFVVLGSADRLVADDGKGPQDMTSEGNGYEAEFDTGAADTEFTVSFEREEDESAPDSTGTLPAPFTISAPTATDEFSRASDEVTIAWDDDSTDDVVLEWDGDCIFSGSDDLGADTGSATITVGQIEATSTGETETCDVNVEVRRTRDGSADDAFDQESWFRAHQVRQTSFRSIP